MSGRPSVHRKPGVIDHTLQGAHLFASLKELTRFTGKRGAGRQAASGERARWAKSRLQLYPFHREAANSFKVTRTQI